jgi:nucleoside-diphosphate-sugar epimerase
MAAQISVVTGGAGFVGQALVRRLLDEGHSVRAVVLPGDPRGAELRASAPAAARLTVVEADITDTDAIASACRNASTVFHTAALVHAWAPWDRFRAANVVGTWNVARAAFTHGVDRVVAISTSDVFGIPIGDEELDESSPYRRWGEPYPDTKIEAEQWLWAFHRSTGLPVTVIYPGWVYGPGDPAFFPGLAAAIEQGIMFFWYRGAVLPWVYIDNLIDACLLAASHPAAIGQGYLVHDDTDGPTLEEACGLIARTIGARPPTLHVPFAIALGAASLCQHLWRLLRLGSAPPLRTVDVKAFGYQWHLPTRKIRRELGWSPRTGVEEGMRRALDDLRRTREGRRR